MSASKTHRLFFALWPSDELRDHMARAVKPLLAGRRARPVRPDNFHMTLAFLGAVAEERLQAVIEAADRVAAEPFDLTFDHVESWRAAHVACITVAPLPMALNELVDRLRINLSAKGIAVDEKAFKAHITVARNWRDRRLDERIETQVWSAREFVLVASSATPEGSEYRIVQRWLLGHAADGGFH